MTAPAHPLAFETLVDYWSADLAPEHIAAIEDHVFACDACAREAERVARIVHAFRGQLPPAISRAQLDALKAKGLAIAENAFRPGERQEVTFAPQLELLVHHLTGLDLTAAERVALTVRSESTGAVLHQDLFAPFDRDRGEVLIACQRHFAVFPRDVQFDIEIHRPAAPPTTASYQIPHVFIER